MSPVLVIALALLGVIAVAVVWAHLEHYRYFAELPKTYTRVLERPTLGDTPQLTEAMRAAVESRKKQESTPRRSIK